MPDTSKATAFTTSVGLLEGLRFVRLRVTRTANLSTAQTAKVASVAIPYVF